MGVGNGRYELGGLGTAAPADLERALQIAPDRWLVRLNRAQVLLELDRACLDPEIVEYLPMSFDHPLVGVHVDLALRLAAIFVPQSLTPNP